MRQVFQDHGLSLEYPGDWELTEEGNDSERVITIQESSTLFWSLSMFSDRPDPERVIEAAIDAFRQEYDEMDSYAANGVICEQQAMGIDLEFVCFELINSAFLRAFQTNRFTGFVLYQGTDHELTEAREQLEDITASLRLDENPFFMTPTEGPL